MDPETGELKSILKELLTECQKWRYKPISRLYLNRDDTTLSGRIQEALDRWDELYPDDDAL